MLLFFFSQSRRKMSRNGWNFSFLRQVCNFNFYVYVCYDNLLNYSGKEVSRSIQNLFVNILFTISEPLLH